MNQQLFSEQEAGEIIRRASEITEASSAADYKPGITQEELEKIAKEVGVPIEALQQAIREAAAGPKTTKKGTLTETQEFVVEGELPPEDFDVVSSQFKQTRRSRITQVGRSLQGRGFHNWGLTLVDMTARNGRTKVKLTSLPLLAILGGAYPAFLAAMFGSSAMQAQHMAPIAGPLWIAACAVGGFFGFRALLEKGKQSTREMAAKLREVISEHVKPPQS